MARIEPFGLRRDPLIDALRGACFALMTANHLPEGILSSFSNPVNGPFGFFTSASGFFFLSGLVSASAYGENPRQDSQTATSRVWKRIRTLYLTQITLYILILLTVAFHLPGAGAWRSELFNSHPLSTILLGLSLLHEPRFMGMLPMYCLYLALTPVILRQLKKDRAAWVLGGSALLWAIAGLAIDVPDDPTGVRFGAFNPLSYQLLFVAGLAFGSGSISLTSLSQSVYRRLVHAATAIAAVFFVLRLGYATSPTVAAAIDRHQPLFDVMDLGPLRLLNFAAFAIAFYSLSRHQKLRASSSPLFKSLAFLGQHSLPVFAWSTLTAYAAMAFLPSNPDGIVRITAIVVTVASLAIPAWMHARYLQLKSAHWLSTATHTHAPQAISTVNAVRE